MDVRWRNRAPRIKEKSALFRFRPEVEIERCGTWATFSLIAAVDSTGGSTPEAAPRSVQRYYSGCESNHVLRGHRRHI